MQTAERTNTATRAPHIDHVVMDNVEVYPLHEAMTHCITLEESKRRLTEMIHDHFHFGYKVYSDVDGTQYVIIHDAIHSLLYHN